MPVVETLTNTGLQKLCYFKMVYRCVVEIVAFVVAACLLAVVDTVVVAVADIELELAVALVVVFRIALAVVVYSRHKDRIKTTSMQFFHHFRFDPLARCKA